MLCDEEVDSARSDVGPRAMRAELEEVLQQRHDYDR